MFSVADLPDHVPNCDSNSGSRSPVGSDSTSPASYLDKLNEERLEKEIIEAAVKRSLEDSMQVHGSYVQCVK
jgi:hypothetical protein